MDIKDVMAKLSITQAQADALDELDGKDGKISEDVFTRAEKLASGDELYYNPSQDFEADGLFIRVRDIFIKNKNEVKDQALAKQTIDLNNTKPLKAHELNYDIFKNKKAEANDFARVILNDIKKEVEYFNADWPQNPYIINYDDFPRPEEFAQFKKQAYESWKDAVEDWKTEHEDAMRRFESTNLDDVQYNIARGFSAISEQLGFETDFIAQILSELGGDITALNECLKRTQSAIIANDNRNAKDIMKQNVQLYKAGEINADDRMLRTNYNIVDEAEKTRETIRTDGEKTRDAVKLNAEQIQEINALSDAISSSMGHYHTRNTVEKVEELKSKIISSNKADFNTKIKGLTELRDLVVDKISIKESQLEKIEKENISKF